MSSESIKLPLRTSARLRKRKERDKTPEEAPTEETAQEIMSEIGKMTMIEKDSKPNEMPTKHPFQKADHSNKKLRKETPANMMKKDDSRNREYRSAKNKVFMLVRITSPSTVKPQVIPGIHVYSALYKKLSTFEQPLTVWSEYNNGGAFFTGKDIKFRPKAGVLRIASVDVRPERVIHGVHNEIEVLAQGWTMGVEQHLQTRVHEYVALARKGDMADVEWTESGELGLGKGAMWTDGLLRNAWWEVVEADVSYLDAHGEQWIS